MMVQPFISCMQWLFILILPWALQGATEEGSRGQKSPEQAWKDVPGAWNVVQPWHLLLSWGDGGQPQSPPVGSVLALPQGHLTLHTGQGWYSWYHQQHRHDLGSKSLLSWGSAALLSSWRGAALRGALSLALAAEKLPQSIFCAAWRGCNQSKSLCSKYKRVKFVIFFLFFRPYWRQECASLEFFTSPAIYVSVICVNQPKFSTDFIFVQYSFYNFLQNKTHFYCYLVVACASSPLYHFEVTVLPGS